jgi:tetratricopeptide (TPR) repeat protein
MFRSSALFIFVTVALSLPTTAQSEQQSTSTFPDFDKLVLQAEEAREADKLWQSIGFWEEALELRPRWTDGRWALATLYYEIDHYSEAAKAFEAVIEDRPNSPEAWSLLGLCEIQLGEYDKALESLVLAEELGLGGSNPFSFVVKFNRALLLTKTGQFETASQILVDLSVLGGCDKPAIREALGISILRLPYLPKELPPAKREQVLLAGKALSCVAIRPADEPVVHFEELVRRFPSEPNVRYAYGNFLAQTQPEKAPEQYLKELELSPDHLSANLEMAFEYLKRGEPQRALVYAKRGVELDPGFFPARNALGRTYFELDQIDDAIRELEKGVELAPGSPETLLALSRAYQKANRHEDAKRAAAEVERLKKAREALEARRKAPPAN